MSVCDDIISLSKKEGADECEAVACKKRTITIRITDSEIAEIKEGVESAAGVRLVREKRIASVQSANPDAARMIQDAMRASRRLAVRGFWQQFPSGAAAYPSVQSTNDKTLWDIDSSNAADIAQEMINAALHPRITNISGSLNIVCEEFEVINTSGLAKIETASYMAGTINSDSDDGPTPVSGIGQANSRTLSGFDASSVGLEASQMCVGSLNPKRADDGITSIIFDPIAVGEMLTFVLAPNFSLKTYCEGRSCFSEKIGTKIASDEVNLADMPHTPNGLGTKSFDDEGVPTRSSHYIRDGVFEGTYSDHYNASKENAATSANACRPGSPLGRSAAPVPVAGPHNLSILGGGQKRDEIIKETKKGIIVGRLWYTYAVNPIRGDFSCTARSGTLLVEDGTIKHPLKQVRIIHNLPRMLREVSAVADNPRAVLSWAASPVTAPTIRCENMTIRST